MLAAPPDRRDPQALVREYLNDQGARTHEVTVTQRQIAAGTGLSVEQVRSAIYRLSWERRIVFDRPPETMEPYTYRIVR